MRKYAFWVHAADYDAFLASVRELGMLHIRPIVQPTEAGPPNILQQSLAEVNTAIRLLASRKPAAAKPAAKESPEEIALARDIRLTQEALDTCRQQILLKQKALQQLAPWGEFSLERIQQIRDAGWALTMFTCPIRKFNPAWREAYTLFELPASGPDLYFVLVHPPEETPEPEANPLPWPAEDPGQLREAITHLESQLQQLEERLNQYATQLESLELQRAGLLEISDQEVVKRHTQAVAEGAVMLLEGFIPENRTETLHKLLDERMIVYISAKPVPEDAPPVQLKNNRFAALFEPISKMYALPQYAELDLTPFFAPFFMLFFGFCLGDAGYGLVLLAGSLLYRFKASPEMKPLLSLVHFLGIATIIFGALTGTVFGVNLLQEKYAWLGDIRRVMLDSNQAFNLALILGFIQTIYGLILQAVNKYRQFGWAYAIPPLGWILLLVSLLDISLLKMGGTVSVFLVWSGVGMIVIFSAPGSGILGRLGKGLWDLYGITGFFGDLLSYIRLFALGISSAVLGFVINDIALQIKGSVPVLGPIMFVAFLIIGHGANLLISSLGSFVHPMRLTFVEFYKNAGFSGGGIAYNPFAPRKKNRNKT
jgi:V/A-type H+/Na+-transporting ATPase subunit I